MPKTNPRQLARHKELRAERRLAGKCLKCGKVDPIPGRTNCEACLQMMNESSKHSQRRLRRKVIEHYGGKCACCGEKTFEFLTVDHKNNDGAQHRRELKVTGVATMMRWIVRNGYPDTLQVLCWNCNAAKQYHGRCPHHAA